MISLYSGRLEYSDLRKRLLAWFERGSARISELYQRLSRQCIHTRSAFHNIAQTVTKSFVLRETASPSLVSVLDNFTTGILILDRTLQTTFTNLRFRELLGTNADTFAVQLLGTRMAECLRHGLSLVFPFTCQQSLSDTNGTSIVVDISAYEIFDDHEEINGYMFVVQEITPLLRTETAPSPAFHRTALDVLASEIMHEIRNPLGSIALYASLIKDRPTGETVRWADEILRASRRLQTTIAQLLSFAAEPRLAAAWLPVPQLLQEVTEATFPMWHSGRWTLAAKVQEELPLLWGDRTLLTQALTNLLANATEAMPQGGTVTIRVYQTMASSSGQREQHAIAIQIEDEGSGIAPPDREKIFTPFFTTKRSGTGVGLALTQKIIHAHHGTIELTDAPVHGCCFTVLLPVDTTGGADTMLPDMARRLMQNEARESI